MKDQIHRSTVSSNRYIKPKPVHKPSKRLPIYGLTFSFKQEETRIFIDPSNICIKAKEILDMIDSKNEFINLANSDFCIQKNDVFSALQLYADERIPSSETTLTFTKINLNFQQPKRPTNAFILYRSAWGKIVRVMFPEFNNSQVSKLLGAMWKWSSKQLKEKYIQQADMYRKAYKEKYPNHVYNTKKVERSNAIHLLSCKNFGNDCSSWSHQDNMLQLSTTDSFIDDFHITFLSKKVFNSSMLDPSGFQACPNPTVPDIPNNEWEKVCNIISDLLPNSTIEDKFVDNQFWDSFQDANFPQDFLSESMALNQNQ